MRNVKALVGAFNQEKALVGAFSVIVQLHLLIVYTALVLLCCVNGTGGRWGSGSTAWTRPSSPSSPWRRAATRASSSSGWSRGPSWRSWADPHTRTNKYIYNLIYAYLLSSKYILLALLLINCICLRRSVTLISLSLEMLRWRREVTV